MKEQEIEDVLRSRGYKDMQPMNIKQLSKIIAEALQPQDEEPKKRTITILHASGEVINKEISDDLILSEVISISHDNEDSAIFVNNTLVYQGSVRDEELEIYYEFTKEG